MRSYIKKSISTIASILILIQISYAFNHSPEEEFVKTFSDNAISILSNTEISEKEKHKIWKTNKSSLWGNLETIWKYPETY